VRRKPLQIKDLQSLAWPVAATRLVAERITVSQTKMELGRTMKITVKPRLALWLITAILACPDVQYASGQVAQSDAKVDRWEADIRKFEEQDRAEAPPKDAVLFVGSSSIRLWDLKKFFPELTTLNRGFGGSQIADVVQYADRIVAPYQPKLIVFYAGDNDLASGKSPETVAGDFAKFVELTHAKLPDTPIIYISIKPSMARWNLWDKAQHANHLIKQQVEADERLKYLDIAPLLLGADGMPNLEWYRDDKLHLNDKGYERWTEALRPLLGEKPAS
jgi:lysophospholipase L1-like esterase